MNIPLTFCNTEGKITVYTNVGGIFMPFSRLWEVYLMSQLKNRLRTLTALVMALALFACAVPVCVSAASGTETTETLEVVSSYPYTTTTKDKVNLRASRSTRGTLVKKIPKNAEITVKAVKGTWAEVTYGKYSGYVKTDYIVLKEVKKVKVTPTPTPVPTLSPEEDAGGYHILQKGDSGEEVKSLQQALIELGFLTGKADGKFGAGTEKAVIAFQASRGLTQDGIAGEKTQHALYNTVPIGTYDSSTVTATLYPVEMVDWYSGGIQTVWANNSIAVITDVYTGISFRAYRIYGGNHADAVPYSAEDTVAYCQMFGTSNAQEIADREDSLQTWRRRPLWVTVGGRTFAASLYGTPHNFSDSIVKNANATLKNNFVGQFCVHFVNSKTHDSSTSAAHVDYDNAKNGNFGHQSAIKYAYNHSISGTK